MSDERPHEQKKTLELRQTWFLALSALAVIFMFAFVILPFVDPAPQLSGKAAPDFDLEIISGGDPGDRIRLSDLQGTTVVIDFWASWCKPCVEQSAILSELAPELGADVMLLGVATSDLREGAEKFLEEEKPEYVNAFDGEGIARSLYGVETLPTLLIVDGAGQIKVRESRVLSQGELRSLISSVGEVK